jgi:hypothetical protein
MNEAMQKALTRTTSIQVIPWSDAYKDQAVAIGREMHANSVYHDLPFDEAKTIRQLAACGNIVPDRYFRLAVRRGVLLGGVYGHVRRTFFCDEILAHDMGWWVTKSARGGMAAIALLADFEKWAREQGARKIMVGQSTGINMKQTTKMFEHCGFRVIGFNTVKDL